MKKAFSITAGILMALVVVGAVVFGFLRVPGSAKASASCTATGFYRDSINLTAVLIATGTTYNVTGPVSASGCNIGVYYGPGTGGTVSNAQIFGANYFGIVNNGGKVTVSYSQVHDIGENPLNGDQHGVAIYYAYDNPSKGTIKDNLIWNYQKGGITVNGVGSNATISHNTVIGQGPVNYIAQNGIQIGFGAKGTVSHNIVTGNSYTGSAGASSGGIIVVGGECYGSALTIGIHITNNDVIGNDVGIWLSNIDGTYPNCPPTLTPTNVVVKNNISTDDGVNNTSGYGPNAGYQAGVSDQGDGDQIVSNSICGLGYTPVTPPPYLYFIDVTYTNNVTDTGNTSCLDGSPISLMKGAPSHLAHHGIPTYIH
ncbi:MAG: right-handed parallel beta-helix repeat-containing protein [Ktedonobacteraceae bacterium]